MPDKVMPDTNVSYDIHATPSPDWGVLKATKGSDVVNVINGKFKALETVKAMLEKGDILIHLHDWCIGGKVGMKRIDNYNFAPK